MNINSRAFRHLAIFYCISTIVAATESFLVSVLFQADIFMPNLEDEITSGLGDIWKSFPHYFEVLSIDISCISAVG